MAKFLRCFSLIFLGIMTACGGGGISSTNGGSSGSHASATLQSIQVLASNNSFPSGLSQQFTATGSYSDGTSKDLTNTAVWSTSNATVAIISAKGMAKGMAPGAVTITATQSNLSGTLIATVSSATLSSISIGFASASVTAGLTDQVTATGNYSDGSTQNLSGSVAWTISNPAVASISNGGLITAKSNGSALVTATMGSISGTGTVNISAAALVSLAVSAASGSVPAGVTDQFTAVGTYSDGSTQPVTGGIKWTSSSTAIATVSNTGLVTTKSHGSVTITATQGTISANAGLNVLTAVLTSITVHAASSSVAAGLTDQFTATGNFSDGTTQNLTNSVSWLVANSTVASISTSGLITGKVSGSTAISATMGSVVGTNSVSVTSPLLVSLSLTAANPSVGVGFTDQFTATGSYSDGSTQNLSSSVTWTLSNNTIASISSIGLVSAISNGSEVVTAASGSVSANAPLTITVSLVSIIVTPTAQTIALATNLQFKATGIFTDGSTQDITSTANWTSSDSTKATIVASGPTGGLAHSIAAGSAVITASSGTLSSSANLIVSAAHLTAITVTPANKSIPLGVAQQFKATGTFDDGTTQDVTNSVTWSSSQQSVASMTVSGLATARNLGTVSILATSAGGAVVGNTLMTVNAANMLSMTIQPGDVTIAQGTSTKLTAIGLFNDGSTRDVSSQASWSSSNTGVALSQSAGRIQSVNPGLAPISVALGSQHAYVNVTVTNATIVSISVTPSIASIAPNTQKTFTATGLFSDSTTQVISNDVAWSSSDTTIATMGNATASSIAAGATTISATFNSVSGSAQLNVSSANVTGLTVNPPSAILAPGTTQQFSATATYDDGTSQNVSALATWTVPAVTPMVISVNSSGQVTGQSTGTATVTASYGGFSNTGTVLVESAGALTSITINPTASTIPQQIMTGFTATGLFSDGSSQNLTSTVNWTSSQASVATISNGSATRGFATGITPGASTISAWFAGQVSTATLVVTNATLVSLSISPGSPSIVSGKTQNFVATATFSDGTTANVSNQAVWTSSDITIAVISTQGLASGVGSGSTTITATLNGVTSSTVLTVQ